MAAITDYLFNKGKGIIEKKPEVSDSTGKYSMADSGGTELEVAELLYGFVRAIKPQAVLTTGIYTGVSDLYIGQALVDNGFGTSDALEYEPKHIERAKKLWMQVGVAQVINEHLTPSLEFTPNRNYDLMFLDTELHLRWHELARYYSYLNEGGYVLIHDFHRHLYKGSTNKDHPEIIDYPSGPVPDKIKELVNQDKLRVTHFSTPRGLVLLYKVHSGDYKWQ